MYDQELGEGGTRGRNWSIDRQQQQWTVELAIAAAVGTRDMVG